ncbi:MAG: Polysaccharide biosynthesis protein [Candidatus Methanofastidiosum methylothiophilum]|jgi:UDP-N-acetylglucosamine 4,6-dehydratase (inverting)|uniref:Polysaccharide biosynthesis protein n=1 Tax=Candidatus Methanofastidiosum methylothiophilum TaxID=1705564 RepID=A0A150JFB9_9EURY|nr:MAG: Polysaccharide biosynthesis protein [Candidatus Methanofastidiosum methylthiophilus]KYC55936.1 MAG: Polysaccharide biosynthesis protein [Candidatus Methanofastidiosum methylthiophilus]KYC56695.1 MAG: Polysaccharide biosynthesis protein [Candidatus Methanofastidiosum methylthiophilus]
MQKELKDDRLRFFIGDVRDKDRLYRAASGADFLIHAAAMKQVPACEYNPIEAVRTNIDGTINVIDAAIDNSVKKVIGISTDKAVHPVNLYGATKMTAEKLLVQGNSYSGDKGTKFSVVRYGNVIGSRGSVIPLFLEQKKNGLITITDTKMTRFWISLEEGVKLVIECIKKMKGGETFVPKIPSMKLIDLAEAVAPECEKRIIGIRPGEKIHEVLLTEDEARHSLEFESYYVIYPEYNFWRESNPENGKMLEEGFKYSSDTNNNWININQLKELINCKKY